MSRRVTVVLSQGHRLGVDRQHREDDVVAGLLMSPLVEATIIADLTRIEPASTDQLCLESIAGTAVLLAWHKADRAQDELGRLGVESRFLNDASGHGESAAGTLRHEFYYYDLNDGEPLDYYLDVVARVAEEVEKAPIALTNLANGNALPLATDSIPIVATPAIVPIPTARDTTVDDELEERDDLDDLMDALDRVEL